MISEGEMGSHHGRNLLSGKLFELALESDLDRRLTTSSQCCESHCSRSRSRCCLIIAMASRGRVNGNDTLRRTWDILGVCGIIGFYFFPPVHERGNANCI